MAAPSDVFTPLNSLEQLKESNLKWFEAVNEVTIDSFSSDPILAKKSVPVSNTNGTGYIESLKAILENPN